MCSMHRTMAEAVSEAAYATRPIASCWIRRCSRRRQERSSTTEHYYPRVEESVAEFNSKYLGGTAHELAHCFGLPHDNGSPAERQFGVSLMGRGNLNYRRDVWHGGEPAYLARASALRLISHPLVTGSDRGRWQSADGDFESLRFSSLPGGVRIEGNVTGKIPVYAAIAYSWPTRSTTDHDARTHAGRFERGRHVRARG